MLRPLSHADGIPSVVSQHAKLNSCRHMATTGKKSEVIGSCRSYVNIVLPYGDNKDERVNTIVSCCEQNVISIYSALFQFGT